MKGKRIISLALTFALTVMGLLDGSPVSAADQAGTAGTDLPIASADNAFGAMLSRKFNEQYSNNENECRVRGIEMDGLTASVTLETAQDCRAVVCVYADPCQDGAPVLVSSGVQAAAAGAETVSVRSLRRAFRNIIC